MRAEPVETPGEVEFDARDLHAVLWMAGLGGFDFLSSQAADVVRLYVEPNMQVVCEELLVSVASGTYTASHHAWTAPSYRQRYRQLRWTLTASAAEPVIVGWQSATQGPNASLTRFPLRRLGLASQRAFDEDRLIDLWVGLDGLFKKETETRGVGINAARRAGRLLNVDDNERKTLNRAVPRSYRVRGDLVHGRSDYSDEQLDEAVGIADGLLRRSLIALLGKTDPIDPAAIP